MMTSSLVGVKEVTNYLKTSTSVRLSGAWKESHMVYTYPQNINAIPEAFFGFFFCFFPPLSLFLGWGFPSFFLSSFIYLFFGVEGVEGCLGSNMRSMISFRVYISCELTAKQIYLPDLLIPLLTRDLYLSSQETIRTTSILYVIEDSFL